MTGVLVIQIRKLSGEDIGQAQGPWPNIPSEDGRGTANRFAASGTEPTQDMAAWTLLLTLQQSGHIQLPPRQRPSSKEFRNHPVPVVALATEPIHEEFGTAKTCKTKRKSKS